jgi:hypothetical protein
MIAQVVALSDVCVSNSPLSVAKQCRMVRAQQGEPKSPSRTTWTFSFVPQAQYHLTGGQHHFERSENIIPHECGTNE